MIEACEHQDFFTTHLENVSKDLYNDGLLRARCPFCKQPGCFLVRVTDGRWRCEQCKEQGWRVEFEKRLGISTPKAESQTRAIDLQAPESQPSARPSIKPSPLSPDVIDGKPQAARPVTPKPVPYIPPPGRRLPSRTVEKRQIKHLSARHLEIIERVMTGQRPKQIAREIGVGRQWLSVVMNSPLFVAELAKRLSQRDEEIDKVLAEMSIDQVEREEAIEERKRTFRAKLEALVPEALAIVRKYGKTWRR